MEKKTVRDIDVASKRVLVRVDYNVPLDPTTNAIADDTRIRETLPTIRYLIEHDARVVLCSHLGRPGGKVVEGLRLAPVAERLAQLLGKPVVATKDCIGPEVEAAVNALPPGGVMLLENVRFHAGDEANDPEFSAALARLADIFVNDAFGAAHRAHASTVGVAKLLPAVAGFLMEKELTFLGSALAEPRHPFVVVLGGAKVSDKIGVIENLASKADSILIGGGMATTFLRATGHGTGQSSVEEDRLAFANDMATPKADRARLVLPEDLVAADRIDATASARVVDIAAVPATSYIADIGPKTIASFERIIGDAKTVVWNGPMGVFEFPAFRRGTEAVARAMVEATAKGATTVVGGGSTAEAVVEMGLADKLSHVSTGGGASLELLQGRTLPGVAALQDK